MPVPFPPTTASRVHTHRHLVPDLGEEGGELALEAQRRAAREVEGGPGAFFPFSLLRFRSLIEATVTGALSRPRRSAARTPSRTLSNLL